MAEKDLVPLHREIKFETLKEAVMWAHDHVLAHRPVPRWISETSGGAGDSLSGGATDPTMSGSPSYSNGIGNKSGRVIPVGNKSPPSHRWKQTGGM